MKVPEPDIMDKYTHTHFLEKQRIPADSRGSCDHTIFKGSIKPKLFYDFKKQISQPIKNRVWGSHNSILTITLHSYPHL